MIDKRYKIQQQWSKVFGPEYVASARDSASNANRNLEILNGLLMTFAFTTLSLFYPNIQDINGVFNDVVRCGIILLILSIIFGGCQLFFDYKWFNNLARIQRKIATKYSFGVLELLDQKQKEQLSEDHKELENMGENSSMKWTVLQVAFVLVGSIMLLYQRLF